jgi:Esterase/lipase
MADDHVNGDREQLVKMAKRARKAFAARQCSRPRASVPVERFAVYGVRTRAGETRVLFYGAGERAGAPVFVNFHGGGFVMGSADDDDEWCRRIAAAVGCTVVNVDYHLAPEHQFPLPIEECYDVVKWVYDIAAGLGIDPARIAIGGHSAGGNLTASLCLLARERREFPVVFQVLDYPPLDLTADPFAAKSRDTLLTPKARAFFSACYFTAPEDAGSPLASPLLARELAGLPAALVITAEYDPLRGEGERYARRLTSAGVGVTYRMFAGCMHAFTHFGPAASQREAWNLIQDELRGAFAK